jgi:hypothetical protein
MANDYLSGYSLVVRADEYWYLKKKMNNYYFNYYFNKQKTKIKYLLIILFIAPNTLTCL